jgi:hypothetical protein
MESSRGIILIVSEGLVDILMLLLVTVLKIDPFGALSRFIKKFEFIYPNIN